MSYPTVSFGRFGVPSRRVRSLLVSAASLAIVLPLAAQPAASQASNDEPVQLPALEVTATLRSEPLLSVPIAVAVISGDQLLLGNLNNLSDITETMPSLTFRSGASNKDTSLLIRGVGTITTSPGTEPDVSTVVDGVVLARPGQSTMDLMDIDHIEVLRGPQGTLFGKNSSVGVVNIVSKEPTGQTQGYVDASYLGGGGEEIVRAGISGAIVPNKLLASVSAMVDDYQGNVQNVFLNRKVNGYQNEGARAKFVYLVSANLKATVIASYIKSYATTPNEGPFELASNTAFPSLVTTPTSAANQATILPVVAYPNNLQVNSSLLGRVYDDNDGLSAQLDWSLGDFKVTSISAYQNWYNNQFEDTGIVPQPTVGQTLSWDKGWVWFDQYSQEFRLTSPTGGLLNYVAGLYFQRAIDTETYHRDIIQEPTAGSLVPNYGEAHYGTHSNNYSAYGEGTWNIAPSFRAITGLRLTDDTLDFYHQRVSSAAAAVPGIQPTLAIHSGSTSATGVSGRGGLQYDLSKGVMVYATYARGYKGPAYNVFFNQTALQVAPLKPETSDDYEAGIKALTLDGRLQFTATVFDTIYQNYQANFSTLVVGTPVTNLINAGQVSSKGVEADARALITPRFTLSASASWDNAKIDSFNTPPGATNVNGQVLPFAPKFKSNVTGEYRMPLTDTLKLNLSTNYAWQDKQQFSLTETPDTIQPSYGIWNATIAVVSPKSGWRVSLLLKNLSNTHYVTLMSQAGGFLWGVIPRDDQRYMGVSIHKDF